MFVFICTGTSIIKKSNFTDHLKKSVTHQTAVLRLSEQTTSVDISGVTSAAVASSQRSIVTHFRSQTAEQQDQLVKKFQLAHFLATQGKSFRLYEQLVAFERDVHQVKLGRAYATDTACAEMLTYLSKSAVMDNIVAPLAEGKAKFYSIHNDGSSSAKTMDEKELFVIKIASGGIIKFHAMSLLNSTQ